jgi:hypothetical protein
VLPVSCRKASQSTPSMHSTSFVGVARRLASVCQYRVAWRPEGHLCFIRELVGVVSYGIMMLVFARFDLCRRGDRRCDARRRLPASCHVVSRGSPSLYSESYIGVETTGQVGWSQVRLDSVRSSDVRSIEVR